MEALYSFNIDVDNADDIEMLYTIFVYLLIYWFWMIIKLKEA